MAEEDMQKKETNLKNAKEVVEEYEKKYGKEGRRIEEEYKRLLGRFTAKILYGWDNGKFDQEYLKKLERNWRRWKGVKFFQRKNLKKGGNVINHPSNVRGQKRMESFTVSRTRNIEAALNCMLKSQWGEKGKEY